MRSFVALAILTGTCLANVAIATPNVDKQRIAAFLRYAEGIAQDVTVQVDDPRPSTLPGFYLLDVHYSLGSQKEDHHYYVSEDGQRVINGSFWTLNQSPFQETLNRLTPDGPSFGVPDARIMIVIFSDFECPFCQQFAKMMRTNLPQHYPRDVRVVMKNYPIMAIHPWSRAAAEAGACMADAGLGAFWAYHDWMFDHQNDVNAQYQKDKDKFPAYLRDTAAGLAETQKVDVTKVRTCIDTHASASQVDKDIAEGDALKVASTPTFYVNGRPVSGAISWKDLDSVIQIELSRPKDIATPLASLH